MGIAFSVWLDYLAKLDLELFQVIEVKNNNPDNRFQALMENELKLSQ